ncbi:hypothetical protein A5643_08500 [Mycobacterium sp. 1274756.6]|nr:hypothetical protein A5643_08500 [Mycobacterium sp. 1274756.6]
MERLVVKDVPRSGDPRQQRGMSQRHPGFDSVPIPRDVPVTGRVPVHLTRFIGREAELDEVRQLVCAHRLVTLVGAGGVGKTRLAEQLAGSVTDEAWWVDLAPIVDPDLVPVRLARALLLPDQPGRSTLQTVVDFLADRTTTVILDNCEHLLDACAELVGALLSACPRLRIVATSREPLGVTGEATWLTPSLTLADEAIELFTDRARLARPDFVATGDQGAAVAEICRRLDGVALAIELAAARVRALSPIDIVDGLHDRFRLLTGGSRAAVPRQQTLRASVDWSHALLSAREQLLFRRLAVFMGGFDLDAAVAVAGEPEVARPQLVDELSLLVGKSLVLARDSGRGTRYRLLETVREYALEKLEDSGEADAVRSRHRDHYTELFAAPRSGAVGRWTERAEVEIDNVRAAFAWSRDHGDADAGSRLASSLQPLWLRGRITEGLSWFDAIGADTTVAPSTRARTLADRLILNQLAGVLGRLDEADQALAIARNLDAADPALLAWVLTACGCTCLFRPELALPYFAEAVQLCRSVGDAWQLAQVLGWQALAAFVAGDPAGARAAGEEGGRLADRIGEDSVSRLCCWCIGLARWLAGDLTEAEALLTDLADQARAAHHLLIEAVGAQTLGMVHAYRGDAAGAGAAAASAREAAAVLAVGFHQGAACGASAYASLAGADVTGAIDAATAGWQACRQTELLAINCDPIAEATLAAGDVASARQWVERAIATAAGVHRMVLLATRVRVAIAENDCEKAYRDGYEALGIAAETGAYLTVPDVLDCLAGLATTPAGRHKAARLFGAAQALRDQTGQVRFSCYDVAYHQAVRVARGAIGDGAFDDGWAEGAGLSPQAAISYALRGHGARKRPTTGWSALTPAELDVIRLVREGIGNKDIAARLFVSPRTVQTHLSHIYTKLSVTSRVQLVQEVTGGERYPRPVMG